MQRFDGVDDGGGDGDAGEPFAVGRNDVPRRPLRRGVPDGVFVRLHVFHEMRPLADIRERELPVLVRFFEPLQEAPSLFFFRHVQEEFADDDALAR